MYRLQCLRFTGTKYLANGQKSGKSTVIRCRIQKRFLFSYALAGRIGDDEPDCKNLPNPCHSANLKSLYLK